MNSLVALPGFTFVGWLIVVAAIAWIISDRLVAALAWFDRANVETDRIIALDHHEPTRTDVEADEAWAEILAIYNLTPADMRARWAELNRRGAS